MADVKRSFTPWGTIVTSVLAACVTTGNADFLDNGGISSADVDHSNASFENYTAPNGAIFVTDHDSSETIDTYCRVALIDEEYDPYDDDATPRLPAWPAEIITLCHRGTMLQDGLRQLKTLRSVLPKDFEDTTTAQVLDAVIVKRIETEIAEIDARIEAYRKANPDPERATAPEEQAEETVDG